MADYGHEVTDKMLDDLEKKIKAVYRKASEEMQEKLNEHLKKYGEALAKKQADLSAGKITKSQFDEWQKGQLLKTTNMKSLVNTLSEDLTHTDEIASDLINGHTPDVYALNFNYGTYEIEKGTNIDTSFVLYSHDTVENLLLNDPDLLPKTSINIPKDMAWNKKHINAAITQGILQGESIPKIANRLKDSVGMSYRAAVRNGRTAVTGAENLGRLGSYERGQKMGIDMERKWLSTLDGRTRHSHRMLDGIVAPLDTDFPNGCRCPGDPEGRPEEVYNCRCTMTAVLKKWPRDDSWKYSMDIEGMTYEEWKNEHLKKAKHPAKNMIKLKEIPKLKESMGDDYKDYTDIIEKSPVKSLYAAYGNKCDKFKKQITGGQFSAFKNEIIYSYSGMTGQDKFSTLAHECGHMFDHYMGRLEGLHFNEIDMINSRCVIGSGMTKTIKVLPSQSDEFLTALRKDMDTIAPKIRDADFKNEMIGTAEKKNASAGVQDAMDGFFGTQKSGLYPWGHGERYYNRAYNKRFKDFGNEKELKAVLLELGFDASSQAKVKKLSRVYEAASEAWANVASAVTVGGDELDAIKKYMPNTLKAFNDIIKGV